MEYSRKFLLLIVEDDINDYRSLRSTLREVDPDRYVVRHAANLEQAADTLAEDAFNVILFGISYPDLAVADQIEELRELAPMALIITLGAIWDSELALHVVRAGADDYLVKDKLDGGRLVDAIDIASARRGGQNDDAAKCALFETCFRQVNEIAFVIDSNAVIQPGHENIARILGTEPEGLFEKPWFQLLHPDDQSTGRATWSSLMRKPGQSVTATLRLPTAKGAWHAHRLQLSNHLGNRAIEGVVVTGQDVSHVVALEQVLQRQRDVLRQLMSKPSMESAAEAALATIGTTFDATDVLLFQYEEVADRDSREATPMLEWRDPEEPVSPAPVIQRMVSRPGVLPRLQDALQLNPVDGLIQLAPRRNPDIYAQMTDAVILAPIPSQDGVWGVVALTSRVNLIDWPDNRRTMLNVIVDTIAMAIAMGGMAEGDRSTSDSSMSAAARVGIGLVHFDERGQLQRANEAVRQITGLEPELVLERFRDALASGQSPRGEELFRRPDGTEAHVRLDITTTVGAAGRFEGGVIALRDVTNLWRALERVRDAEAYGEALVETSDAAMLILDNDARLQSVSPAAEQMLGIRGTDVTGRTLAAAVAQRGPGDGQIFLHNYLERPDQAARNSGERELPALRADGSTLRVAAAVGDYRYHGQQRFIVALREADQRAYGDKRVSLQLKQLEALQRIDRVIASTRDQQVILDVMADQVVTMPDIDIVVIRSFSEVARRLDLKAARGLPVTAQAAPYLLLGQGSIGRAAVDRQPLKLMRLQETLLDDGDPVRFSQYAVADGIAIPLISNLQLHGTLEAYRYDSEGISDETRQFLTRIASQAALAVDETNVMEELERSRQLLEGAYETTLEGWSRALELRGVDTKGHIPRVTEQAVRLGRALGLRERDLLALRRGAFLHDVGKIAVPDAVLHKPGALDEDDWEKIREIPHHAMNMLSGNTFLRDASVVPYFHNEKWDGTGYPNGLSGETIPLAARIFAVVDVWDTLISDRPYRKALTHEEAIEQLQSMAGTSFDPVVVETFLGLVASDVPAAELPADSAQPEAVPHADHHPAQGIELV